MKQSITTKRAMLYREWLLARLANDERYYLSTLTEGIPDGDTQETVMQDLTDGFYDEWLDEMINLYHAAKKRFGKFGYVIFINGKCQVVDDENEALKIVGWEVPEKIYKNRQAS